MATRSLIVIKDKSENQTVFIYKHFDGYDVAKFLDEFFKEKRYVDGFSDYYHEVNGFGDLVSQVISALKCAFYDRYEKPWSRAGDVYFEKAINSYLTDDAVLEIARTEYDFPVIIEYLIIVEPTEDGKIEVREYAG